MTVSARFVSLEAADQPRASAGGRPGQGVYYTPGGSPPPRVALIATHYEVDFSEHYLAEYMAERGYGFLGWNTRYRGNGLYFNLSRATADIGTGVSWLLGDGGASAVVLLGNSGGASLMAAYQSAGAGRAAAFVSLNAHPGRPDVLTAWLDPSVTDEADPLSADPSLDMFAADHGPPYEPAFVGAYRAAQTSRNHRITAWCRAELARLSAAGAYDRAFTVPRTWADLRFNDLTIDPSDRAAGCYGGDARSANYSPYGLAVTNTCRSWLEMWSLSHSPCRAAPHLAALSVPALVVQSTGDQGCFPSDAHAIFDAVGSADKQLEWLPGAHYFETGGRDDVADLIAGWLDTHL
jgi:pimeloyl-ACP methyl ester carboxylesterase